jgi:hypothetical protein
LASRSVFPLVSRSQLLWESRSESQLGSVLESESVSQSGSRSESLLGSVLVSLLEFPSESRSASL